MKFSLSVRMNSLLLALTLFLATKANFFSFWFGDTDREIFFSSKCECRKHGKTFYVPFFVLKVCFLKENLIIIDSRRLMTLVEELMMIDFENPFCFPAKRLDDQKTELTNYYHLLCVSRPKC